MPSAASSGSQTLADQRWMSRALALARDTTGLASPNPQVGCVLVRPSLRGEPDVLLAEGSHRYATRDHAEIVALQAAAAAGQHVRGATAYVTLEPCAHHGRTGPCAEALVAAGIGRCVVATTDPNPLVSGAGLRILEQAGIPTTLGPGEFEARSLNLPFAHSIQHRRPFVTLKAALSVDGFLAPPAATRLTTEPHWLTGPLARAEVHRLRHASDAILTGIGTVLADDPVLTDRSTLPRRRPLLRVILDTHLRLPLSSHLLRSLSPEPDLLLLCGPNASTDRESALLHAAPGLQILRLPTDSAGHISLPAVLDLLHQRQCLSVLLEGGSILNAAFLKADRVDRVVLFFSERELGAGSIPFAAGGPSPFALVQHLQQRREHTFGTDAMVTGLLHDPWSAHTP